MENLSLGKKPEKHSITEIKNYKLFGQLLLKSRSAINKNILQIVSELGTKKVMQYIDGKMGQIFQKKKNFQPLLKFTA